MSARSVAHVLRGHDTWVRSGVFVAQGTQVLSGDYEGDLRLWDARTGEILRVMHAKRGFIYEVAGLDDGKWGVAINSNAALGLWDLATGTEAHAYKTRSRWDLHSTVCGDVSPDHRHAAAGEREGTVYVWDLGPATNGDH